MTLIADILMISGAMGAAFYCMVLSRRLRKFSDLEQGVGGAVAVLSVQVDDMTKTIEKAEKAAIESADRLNKLTARAETAARKLELMIAAMHDLPVDTDSEKPAEARVKPEVKSEPKAEVEAPKAASEAKPEVAPKKQVKAKAPVATKAKSAPKVEPEAEPILKAVAKVEAKPETDVKSEAAKAEDPAPMNGDEDEAMVWQSIFSTSRRLGGQAA